MVTNAHTPSQQIRPPYLLSTERTNGKRKEGKAARPAEGARCLVLLLFGILPVA